MAFILPSTHAYALFAFTGLPELTEASAQGQIVSSRGEYYASLS